MSRPREKYWFALRVFKGMAQAKKDFEDAAVRTFVPYRMETAPDGRVKNKAVPLVSSLIFVYASAAYVKEYAYSHTPGVRYYPDLESKEPGIIRDEEMEPFMRVTSPLSPDARYFDNDAPEYHKGDAVLITEGQFKGMEGHIFRVGKDRKVVVSIRNVCSLLISNISPSSLKPINSKT